GGTGRPRRAAGATARTRSAARSPALTCAAPSPGPRSRSPPRSSPPAPPGRAGRAPPRGWWTASWRWSAPSRSSPRSSRSSSSWRSRRGPRSRATRRAAKRRASSAEFQAQLRAAGFVSEEEWRRWLAEQQRRSILQQRLIEELKQKGKLRPIPPSEAEMREFWEANRAQQPKRPAAVSFRQIVIVPKPDSAAKARALQLAESL